MIYRFILIFISNICFAQKIIIHPNAHAHNDYVHARPLKDALQNGFLSVEADVHLLNGHLLVGHNQVSIQSPSLEQLYLKPLDSLLKINNGSVYPGEKKTFFLMIDIKTKAEATYYALKILLNKYEVLKCNSPACSVKFFLSGNRPIETILTEGYAGIGVDGRPEDIGKGFSNETMPVISDTYQRWSSWNGKQPFQTEDLKRIRELAQRVHAEGKKLRLWAIPDNEIAWQALLDVGVDLINTDHLEELHSFLTKRGM